MKQKTLWVTRTAVMIALLVGLQTVTKAGGQFLTGSCVNLVLGISAFCGGLWCGLTVALLSPFFALLLGIGPAFIQLTPAIAAGNIVFVLLLWLISGRTLDRAKKLNPLCYIGAVIAAVVKFAVLYLLIVKLILPLLGLAEKQVAVISLSFSWPQLITALIGGFIAVTAAPLIKRAISGSKS